MLSVSGVVTTALHVHFPGVPTTGENVAHNLCVPTATVTVEIPLLGAGSVTVPVNVGVLLVATCPSMLTVGFPVSRSTRWSRYC